MSKLFDVTSGKVCIGSGVVLCGGSTPQELTLAGLVFTREFDMETGWVFRTTGPQDLMGHIVQLSLGFQYDLLKRVSFGFAENPNLDMDDLFKKHEAFLYQELGAPTHKSNHQTLYQYAWGEIVSEMDPRGSGCYILVTWNA